MKEQMNIAIAFNDAYTKYACVLLTSVLEHHRDYRIVVYALYATGGLNAGNMERVSSMLPPDEGEVVFLEVDPVPLLKQLHATESWTVESFLRLALPDLLPQKVERLLYLDIDMIVNASLAELYFSEMGDACVASCRDMGSSIPFNDVRDRIFAEHIKQDGFFYFCAGMMLWNLPEIRKTANLERFLKTAEDLNNELLAPDQDLLNYVFAGRVIEVDATRYDAFTLALYGGGIPLESVRSYCAIVHYSGPKPWSKPWNAQKVIRGIDGFYEVERLWWEYARKTPYYCDFLAAIGEEGGLQLRSLFGYSPEAIGKTEIGGFLSTIRNVTESLRTVQTGFEWEAFSDIYDVVANINFAVFNCCNIDIFGLRTLIGKAAQNTDGGYMRLAGQLDFWCALVEICIQNEE